MPSYQRMNMVRSQALTAIPWGCRELQRCDAIAAAAVVRISQLEEKPLTATFSRESLLGGGQHFLKERNTPYFCVGRSSFVKMAVIPPIHP